LPADVDAIALERTTFRSTQRQCYSKGVPTPPAGPFWGTGTHLRHVLELLDGDVAKVYADLGIDDYRPRFSPFVRALVARGPSAIRDLARVVSVTHSAASQTVAQMRRCGFVVFENGGDARERIVHLTPKAQALLPILDAEWAATAAAAADLDAELPFPLSALLMAITQALEQRPFRQRIAEAARAQGTASRLAALAASDESLG